jgi:hypothetical protein
MRVSDLKKAISRRVVDESLLSNRRKKDSNESFNFGDADRSIPGKALSELRRSIRFAVGENGYGDCSSGIGRRMVNFVPL